MEVIVSSEHYGASVSVAGGETIIRKDNRDFPVRLENIERKGIEAIETDTVNGLRIRIEQENGWVVLITEDFYQKRTLTVTRFRQLEKGSVTIEQYLSKDGEWHRKPKKLNALPRNAMRIPILTEE